MWIMAVSCLPLLRVLSANPANPPVEKDDLAYEGAEQEG
jgi:hypothetical protein